MNLTHSCSGCSSGAVNRGQALRGPARSSCIRTPSTFHHGIHSQWTRTVSVQASFTDAGAYQGVAPVGTGSDGALSLEAFDERVVFCGDMDDLKGQLRAAGNKLVLLELQSDSVCETKFDEQPELHWKADQEAALEQSMEACVGIKQYFARIAREVTDVVFLEMVIPEGPDGNGLKEQLGVSKLPAVQFYKQGFLLWEQEGFENLEKELGEGVMYYGDAAGNGVKPSEFVADITSRQALDKFVHSSDPTILKVLDVSTTLCGPCIKVFPAVLALAKNFMGHVEFGRLMGDDTDETEALMHELDIVEVPTFIFYRGGRELGRHVGSSRGDLIGQILNYQSAAGLALPPPPPRTKVRSRSAQRQKAASRRW